MNNIKCITLFVIVLACSISFVSCNTFTSQETELRYYKYFKILANNNDDSVFIKVQEEMEIHPIVSNYILIVNVLNDEPIKHYVVFGEETDPTAVRANFYTLSKKTRDKLLSWNMENITDLENPIYYSHNQWTKVESEQQKEERLKKEVGGYTKEITDYKKALKLNPKDENIIERIERSYRYRGAVYEKLDESTKAISDYSKAIEILPKNASAYYDRGLLYYRIKEYSKAISDFTKTVEYDSSKTYLYFKIIDCYYNRAEKYYDEDEFTKAIYDYKKIIALDTNQSFYRHEDIYSLCGLAYIGNKDYINAISIYNKILENNPRYSLAYLYRGIAYCENRNVSKGCKDLQRAFTLGIPNAKEMWFSNCE